MTTTFRQTMPLDTTLQQAVAHHQAGRLQEAEQLYRAILQIQPNHPDASHNLGVIAVQVGKPAAGLPHLKAALDANPNQDQYWLSYIDALIQAFQTHAAREVLEQGLQRGLQGEAVEALAGRLLASAQAAEQASTGYQNYPSQHELNTLVDLFSGGLYAEAAALAHTMTVRYPLHGFSWKMLGVLFKQMGRSVDALVPMKNAAALSPNDAEAHCNLGTTLKDLGRLDEATASYRRALKIKPNYVEAHYNLGVALKELGRLDEAAASYRRALKIRPDYAEAHNNLGVVLKDLGRLDEAVASYRRALKIKPDYAEAHNNLGVALKDLGRLDEAAASYRRALKIKPDYVEAHSNLGNALSDLGRSDVAEASYRRALEIKPDFAEAHYNLGKALWDLGLLYEAEASYRRVLEIKPDFSEAHYNLGMVLSDLGRLDEAASSYRRALEIKPDYDEAHFNLSLAMLGSGRLTEGWAGYEHRFFKVSKRNFTHRYWAGEDLADKSFLIWGEQGIGDEIMFASMYAEIIARAGRCVIECANKLLPLFVRTFPNAQVVPKTIPPHPATLKNIDYQCAAGSLARWLRPSLESFPAHAAYLAPAPERVAYWKTRLAALGPGLKVGFCWRSSLMTGVRPLYYTKLDQWGPIFAVPGVHFVNLQYDECSAELNEARQRSGVPLHAFEEVDLYNDLDEAAALTQSLDIVVSAGTAAAAVAAALGVPTWLMTFGNVWPTHGTDRYPWFPSVRLFHRSWKQPWEEIILNISTQLAERVRIP